MPLAGYPFPEFWGPLLRVRNIYRHENVSCHIEHLLALSGIYWSKLNQWLDKTFCSSSCFMHWREFCRKCGGLACLKFILTKMASEVCSLRMLLVSLNHVFSVWEIWVYCVWLRCQKIEQGVAGISLFICRFRTITVCNNTDTFPW